MFLFMPALLLLRTVFTSVRALAALVGGRTTCLPGLAVQGFEPLSLYELLAGDLGLQLAVRRPFLANTADASLVLDAPGINQRFIGQHQQTLPHAVEQPPGVSVGTLARPGSTRQQCVPGKHPVAPQITQGTGTVARGRHHTEKLLSHIQPVTVVNVHVHAGHINSTVRDQPRTGFPPQHRCRAQMGLMGVRLDDINQPQIKATQNLKIVALGLDIGIEHRGVAANRIGQQVADVPVGRAKLAEYHRDPLSSGALAGTTHRHQSKRCARPCQRARHSP
jgi:hypothetical protein